MVCTLGSGQMSVMARLLGNGICSEMTADEVGDAKLVAEAIHRELHKADEANLLEEEDMHVFDCKPMVDLLHLVCCNNCKKPVKASQYAAHAEWCASLNCSEEILLEIDGRTGHKKLSRKGRKKEHTVHKNIGITVKDHEKFGSMGGNETAALESVVEQTGLTSSGEAKRHSVSVSMECVKNGPVLGPGSTDYTAVVTSPSEKRTKLIVAEHLLMVEGVQTGHGVTREDVINIQPTYPPAPLATKIYHSQRNLRLRLALNHLYYEASKKDHCNGDAIIAQETLVLPSLVPSPKDELQHPQQIELLQEKKDAHSLTTDQNLAGSSEHCLENSSGYTLAVDLPNQSRDKYYSNSTFSVDTSTMGAMRKRYISSTYPCTGTALGNIQKPGGSVPVV